METANETAAQALSQCPTCLKPLTNNNEKVCSECGCPLAGTAQEIDTHRSSYMHMRAIYQGCMLEALTATKSLYWLSGLSLIGNLIVGTVSQSSNYLIAAFLVPAIFIPLALWSRREPYLALLIALIVYILILLTDAIMDPKTIIQGIILKGIIIGYLIKGVKAGNESRKIWNQLKDKHWIQEF
jgi:hypothetical protein